MSDQEIIIALRQENYLMKHALLNIAKQGWIRDDIYIGSNVKAQTIARDTLAELNVDFLAEMKK